MIKIKYRDAQDVIDVMIRIHNGEEDSFSLMELIKIAPSHWTLPRLINACEMGMIVKVLEFSKSDNKISITYQIKPILTKYEIISSKDVDFDLFAEIFGKDSSPIAEKVQVV